MGLPPFDWYTFNFGNFTSWLGTVMTHLYDIWLALWTPLVQLPNVSTHEWPSWIKSLWTVLLQDLQGQPNFLGSLTLIEFALGSYLIVSLAILVVRAIVGLLKK